jgi:hypothetical protein
MDIRMMVSFFAHVFALSLFRCLLLLMTALITIRRLLRDADDLSRKTLLPLLAKFVRMAVADRASHRHKLVSLAAILMFEHDLERARNFWQTAEVLANGVTLVEQEELVRLLNAPNDVDGEEGSIVSSLATEGDVPTAADANEANALDEEEGDVCIVGNTVL